MFKRVVLSVVLVSLLVSLLAPVAAAQGPNDNQGGQRGWLAKVKRGFHPQNAQQRTFFNGQNSVRTGIPGVRGNDLTTAEGRAAFQAPKLGASQWYQNLSSSALNAAQSAYNNQ
jgi:hypothetical protein